MAATPSVPSTFKLTVEVARALDEAARSGLVKSKSAAANEGIASYLRRLRLAQGDAPQR